MSAPPFTHKLRALAASTLFSRAIPSVIHSEWRIFGSWAMALQSAWVARFPNDIDVEVAEKSDLQRVQNGWHIQTGELVVRAEPSHRIEFSAPHQGLEAHWQTVTVALKGTVLSEEMINWVFRQGDFAALGGSSAAKSSQAISRGVWPDSDSQRSMRSSVGSHPVASIEACMAMKWTRLASIRTGGRRHTRWEDVADLYDVAILGSARCDHSNIVRQMRWLTKVRGLDWPALLGAPPAEWADDWDRYNYMCRVSRPSPAEAVDRLNAWWQKIRAESS